MEVSVWEQAGHLERGVPTYCRSWHTSAAEECQTRQLGFGVSTLSGAPWSERRCLGSENTRTNSAPPSQSSPEPAIRRRTMPSQEPVLGERCTSTSGIPLSSSASARPGHRARWLDRYSNRL